MKILFITHQLSRTGAPIVLMDVIKLYRSKGCEVEVVSMEDGVLREELEKDGILVSIMERFWPVREVFAKAAKDYDLVWANTLITYEAVLSLMGTGIPVVWWLHEGEQYFEYFKTVLPDFAKLEKDSNIRTYAVGHYVQDVVKKRYGVTLPILHFAVGETETSGTKEQHFGFGADGKLRFLIAGTYSQVKAQDVLCEAVRMLPADVLKKTEFYFCGNENMVDESILSAVKKLDQDYDNVTMLHQLTRNEVFERMSECDLLLVPSRIDPIPTVAVEMMQCKRPVLCTEVCGVAHYITDGENGFTVKVDDAAALCHKITEVVEGYLTGNGKKSLEQIGLKGYEIYRDHFSKEVVEKQLQEILMENTKKRAAVFVMTHKKFDEPEDKTYVPLQVGAEGKALLPYLHDNNGVNISAKNCFYGELTGVYWLWKNLEVYGGLCPDYVGICHYRRYFVHEDYSLLSEKDYIDILKDHDVITSTSVDEGMPYRDYFGEAHHIKDIELEGEIIKEICPEYSETFERVMSNNRHYYGNLCVMKREDFNAYCSWLFGIFEVMEGRIDLTGYDEYHRRIYGFLSEQLLMVWLEHNKKSVYECKIGMTSEKAETVEFKLAIGNLLSNGNIKEARELFYEILKVRPDIRLPLSDIKGEIPLIEQILYMCEVESGRGLKGLLDHSVKLQDLIAHIKKLVDILASYDEKAGFSPEDEDYFKRTYTTAVAVEVLCRNTDKLKSNMQSILAGFEKVYDSMSGESSSKIGEDAPEMIPAVSVIVPVYNAADYLSQCIGNLLHQTLRDIEIILVNDASTDDSLKICMDAESLDPERVLVVNLSENMGAGGARNAGLMYARGEYIGFVDSDDIPDVTMFEKLYNAARSGDHDMADAGYYNEETGVSMVHTPDECTGKLDDKARSELIVSGGFLWTRLFKHSVFDAPGDKPFREHCILEDADFLTYVYATADSVCNVKEVLYNYRKCGISIHNEKSSVKYDSNIKAAMRAIYDRVHELPNYKNIQAAVEYELLQMYALGVTNIASDYKGAKKLDSKSALTELAELKKSVVELGYDNEYVTAKIDDASVRAMKAADRGWDEVLKLMK